MKDLIGSRWLTEPTEELSSFPSLLTLRESCEWPEAAGVSSSCEAWDEAEDGRLPHEEPNPGDDMLHGEEMLRARSTASRPTARAWRFHTS